MTIEKAIYTACAKAMGERVGTAKSDDGQIALKLGRPVEMSGKGNGIRIPENVVSDLAVSFGP
jgi:organic hydroperoxide reductase OsmC/OhrA